MIRTLRFWTRIRSPLTTRTPSIKPVVRCIATVPGISRNIQGVLASSRNYSQKIHTPPEDTLLSLKLYDDVCTETLEQLTDYFEEVLETTNCLDSAPDVMYSVRIDAFLY